MKLPISDKEAREKILSQESKDNGLTELDLEVMHLLIKTEKNFYPFDVEYRKALDLGDLVVVVGKGKIGSLIGRKGQVVRELSRALNKKVRVIEETKDTKKMVQDLVGSARVLGVNHVFEEGNDLFKVIIKKADENMLIAPKENLEKGLNQLLQSNAVIRFV